MYRIIFIICGLLLCGLVNTAQSQNHFVYTESGTRVNLTVQDSVISVKFGGGMQLWDGIFAAETALSTVIPPEPLCDGFYRIRVVPGNDPESLVTRLRTRGDISFASLSFLDENNNPIYLTETFVANFTSSTSQVQIDSINNEHSVEVVDSLFGDPHWLLLRVTQDSDMDVLSMGNSYHESSIVNFARASMVLNFQLFGVPSDEYWQHQWSFQNIGQTGGTPDADIDLELAYDYFQSPSAYVTVAMLDDGFVAHEDFPSNRLVGGWDYASNEADFSPGPLQSHGMSCLGLIAADTGSSTGIAGISYNARIIGQKIANDNGALTASDGNIARALGDAVLAGARVISNSWGCYNCDALYPVTPYWIRMCDSLGAVVVFSSGNFGAPTVAFPGNVPEVISVGATDKNDSLWSYSSVGDELDVVAPSGDIQNRGDIWSLDQMGNLGSVPIGMICDSAQGNYNCRFGGTSAACPQVAGVVAMLLRRRPDLVGNTEQIRKILRYSSERTPFGKLPGDTARVNNFVGWGRLNAARALLSVVRGDANNSGSVTSSDVVYLNNYIFNFGPAPVPHVLCGDADGNGAVSISDCVKLVQYIFGGGSAPPVSFKY